MSLFYSNPPGGRASIFTILFESVNAVTQLNCFDFGGFAANFLHIYPANIGTFFLNVVFFFIMIWLFLWQINVFNVRHWIEVDFDILAF